MAKYNYWHIIIAVSKEYKKLHPQVKVGLAITHPYKHDNLEVDKMDLAKGVEYNGAYTLKYLGRIEKSLSGDKLFAKLKELNKALSNETSSEVKNG